MAVLNEASQPMTHWNFGVGTQLSGHLSARMQMVRYGVTSRQQRMILRAMYSLFTVAFKAQAGDSMKPGSGMDRHGQVSQSKVPAHEKAR